MKDILMNNWTLMRVVRLFLGSYVAVQGIVEKQYVLVLFGVSFAVLALLNLGCCGTGGCNTDVTSRKSNSKNDQELIYEEVV